MVSIWMVLIDCGNVVEVGEYDPNDDPADLADLEDHQ